MKDLNHITSVCSTLGITSRTLRYYEKARLIKSTHILDSNQRYYTKQQIAHIKNIIVLRKLGIPVKSIQNLLENHVDLSVVMKEQEAKIIAKITSHINEINLLQEAITLLNHGGNVYEVLTEKEECYAEDTIRSIADACTECFISGKIDLCYASFSDILCEYLPLEVFRKVREDTLLPIGSFVSIIKKERDKVHENIMWYYLQYEKLGLSVKYVFHAGKIDGIWLNYFEKV